MGFYLQVGGTPRVSCQLRGQGKGTGLFVLKEVEVRRS